MKVQGTQDQKPAQVEKIRTHVNDTADIAVRWDITEETDTDPDTGQESTYWGYEKYVFEGVELNCPESEIANYLQGRKDELIKKAKAKEGKLTEADKNDLSYPNFDPSANYKGTITEIDGANKKVKVKKTIGNRTISAWCYADYKLLLANQNGDLAVGDMVIISFVDEDLDLPYAHGLPLGV